MERAYNGIKESELNNLSLEVLDYADRTSEIFDKIDSLIDQLPSCYKGAPYRALISKYKTLSSSFNTLNNNIRSYSDDFITVIQKMQEGDKELGDMIDKYAEELNQNNNINF